MNGRRLARLAGVAGLVVGGLLLVVAPTAGAGQAASIDDTGWWTRTNQGPVLDALGGADVDEGQLLVEGAPDQANAIAALRATLPADTGSPVLTLQVASELGGADAVLLACQAGATWNGEEGGAWGNKPSPDCAQSVQGQPSDDGSEWTFPLGPLQFGNQLNVVLTPGIDESRPNGINGSTFRIVFGAPTPASIQVTEIGGGFSPSPQPDPSFDPPPAPSFDDPGSGFTPTYTPIDSGSSFTPPADSGSSLDDQPARASLPDDEQGQTATAPVLGSQNRVPVAAIDDGADLARFFGFVVVLAAGGLLAWSNSQALPERMVLSRFAASASSHTTVVPPVEEEQMGGLGRFRRARSTPARRIGG